MMKTPSALFLFSLLLYFILSCSSVTAPSDNGVGGTGNIALDNSDESGIGGTGKKVASGIGGTGKQIASGLGGTGKKRDGVGGTGHNEPQSGLGGTGQIASDSGLGGTGIIGEVTGFGSIFVNGIEVEISESSEIRSNNKIDKNNNPHMGDIVEILAQRIGDETKAIKLNIRNEIIGPVETINLAKRQFTIIGQLIQVSNPKIQLPDPGDMVAVSGLRDRFGIIHATRLKISDSKSVWLIDTISSNKQNILKLGRATIYSEHANYYAVGDIIRVRAKYKNGVLTANEIFSNQAFGNKVQHMLLQGFITKGNKRNYKIGNIQFSTRSARIRAQLNQNQGRWTRIEVSRNNIGLWEVDQLIANSNLERGSSINPYLNLDFNRSNRGSKPQSSIHQRFNRSLDDDYSFSTRDPDSSGNSQRNHNAAGVMRNMPTSPDSKSPMPNMPRMPTPGGSNNDDSTKPRMPNRRSRGSGGMN